jgi:TolB-like protein
MSDVFVSYASPDGALANAIVAALERRGINCWIAPRDVTPGMLYADVIIRAINEAQVLVLVLSRNSVSSPHVGKEVERASAKQRPVIAVRTDETPLTPSLEYFLSESQWIDAAADGMEVAAAKLVEAVRRLKESPQGFRSTVSAATATAQAPAATLKTGRIIALASGVLVAIVAALGFWFWHHRASETAAPAIPGAASTATAQSTQPAGPPPHSIAVLPFVNMSGDPQQDYFSDGLSEELLNSLAAIPGLQVAARTSSFSFKGKNADVADIASKLNVGAVLEGSVRKEGNEVRITAQLINALTGFHLWSHTYDRDLKNVLSLQTEIATAVTQSLQATLLANVAANIELGGTQNPAAFDAYLRGKSLERQWFDQKHMSEMIAAYQEAIRNDPKFAKAYVELSAAQNLYANFFGNGDAEERSHFEQSRANAEKAGELAPGLGSAHAVLASVEARGFQEYARAQNEYELALSAAPNDTYALLGSGEFKIDMGHTDAGLEELNRAVALDPLNPESHLDLGIGLQYSGRYQPAIEAFNRALEINPADVGARNHRGFSELMLGQFDAAQKDCGGTDRTWVGMLCMTLLYHKQREQSQAEAELAAMLKSLGNGASYQYVEIYAQWGDVPKALYWLDTALKVRDPGITELKVDPLLDPLRKEPHFQEIERKLNFPS